MPRYQKVLARGQANLAPKGILDVHNLSPNLWQPTQTSQKRERMIQKNPTSNNSNFLILLTKETGKVNHHSVL